MIGVLFVKLKEMSVKKKSCFYCAQFFRFLEENPLWLCKKRSRSAGVDKNDTKFMFCVKNWFLEFIIPLSRVNI